MSKLLKRFVSVCAVVLVLAFAAAAQKANSSAKPRDVNAGKDSKNVAVVIVGSAAKAAWVTTKFTAKHVVKPVLKVVFLQAAPKLTLYALRKSPKIAAKIAPTALKLALL